MYLPSDTSDEIKAAKKLRMPGWAVVCLIVASFLFAQLSERFGRTDLVLPILNSVGVLGLVIALKRKLWWRAWFWGTIAAVGAVHVALVLYVPWGTRWVPALAVAVIDSADFCLILWILTTVGKLMGGRSEESKA